MYPPCARAVIGFLLNDYIDALLENVIVVAVTLLLGGIVLIYVDKWFAKTEESGTSEVTYPTAFKIGLFQCIAMIPGVSRSAATIIGGLTQKMNRKAAAEFFFFLAIPTMLAATGYKLLKFYKDGGSFHGEEITVLLVGNVVAFIVAAIAIKGFIISFRQVGRGFRPSRCWVIDDIVNMNVDHDRRPHGRLCYNGRCRRGRLPGDRGRRRSKQKGARTRANINAPTRKDVIFALLKTRKPTLESYARD